MKFKYFFSVFIITLCSLLIINVDNIEARGAARYETTGVLQSQVKLTTDRRMYNNFSGGYDSRLRAVTVNGVSVPAFCVDFGRVGTASLTQIPYQKDAKIDETTAIGRALTYAVLRGYSNDGNTAWYGANTVPALFKDYANFNNIDNRYYATQLAIWQIIKHYGNNGLSLSQSMLGADIPNTDSPIATVAKNLANAAIDYADHYEGRSYQLYPSIHGATAKSEMSKAKSKGNGQNYYEIPLTIESTGYSWMKVTVSGGTNVKFSEDGKELATGNSWTWDGLDPLKNATSGLAAYSKNITIQVDAPTDTTKDVVVTIESDNAVYNPTMYLYRYTANPNAQRILVPLFEIKTKRFYKQYTYKLTKIDQPQETGKEIQYETPEKEEPEKEHPEPKVTTTGTLTIYKTTADEKTLLGGAKLTILDVNSDDEALHQTFNVVPMDNGHYYYCGPQSLGTDKVPEECTKNKKKDMSQDLMYAATWQTIGAGESASLDSQVEGSTPHIKANPIVIEGVPTGIYEVSEDGIPSGYASGIAESHSRMQIRVYENSDSRNTYYVTNTEKPKGQVEISKQDVTTSKEVPGASLKVVTADSGGNCTDNIIAEWESSDNPYVITDLSDGTYCLTETMAPEGYDKTEETVKFTITNGSSEKVVMKNSPSNNVKNPDTSDLNFGLIGGLAICAIIFGGYSIVKMHKTKKVLK